MLREVLTPASSLSGLPSSAVMATATMWGQYQYRHNEGGDCLLFTEILQHQASPGLGSWEGGQLLRHSTWPTHTLSTHTYNVMYNI